MVDLKTERKSPEISPLNPEIPVSTGAAGVWSRLYGSARGLAIVEAAKAHQGPVLVVLPEVRTSYQILEEIRFYAQLATDLPILIFPDRESLPYDAFSPHPDIVSRRLQTLYRLPDLKRGIVIATITTLMHKLCPPEFVNGHSFLLHAGETLDSHEFRERLSHAGYQAVSQVIEPGEFAIRGGLIDLYPMGSATPYRVDLFGDEVESIRTFDPGTQRSHDKLGEIELLPAREFPMTEAGSKHFRQAFRARFAGDPQKSSIYRDVSNGIAPSGAEYYLPLYFETLASFFDYLPQTALCIYDEAITLTSETFTRETAERYEQLRFDSERPVVPPADLFLSPEEIANGLNKHTNIKLLAFRDDERQTRSVIPVTLFATRTPPNLPVDRRSEQPYRKLCEYIENYNGRVLLAASSPGRRETLKALLRDHKLESVDVDGWQTFLQGDQPLSLTVADVDKGLVLPDSAISVITEAQLYGERAIQQRRRAGTVRDSDSIIRSLAELKPGDPVVHEDHGIGRYLGLQTLDVGDGNTEFLTLEYAGGDKIYLPVVSLHFISRYTATNPENAPLHKLGGDAWEKARKRAQKKAHDAAVELLEVHALRETREGFAFPTPDEQYAAFAEAFPFEETPDQGRAINELIGDMTSNKPMDRLVCGDVGFGKTEVAMRAAFLATHGLKQVAILAPTTLLAQQHYQNFVDRFAELPVKIDILSRFRSKKEQEVVLQQLASGSVDIVVGTHRLLQHDIQFKDLGLTIIDEEHRFGVRQKERLKRLRADTDILTLTATPIPRTLNMAMAGLRDISIIATPPRERTAVKTFVMEWNAGLIREACLREIRRGGQVFYLHNEVRTMDKTLKKLADMVPEAEIHMAHGQLPERELEQVMLDFYHQRFNILLCSTIIESGIDVPTANTIIIERADKFGLAQLHQLRGRVGRSHHRAYAYLIRPPRQSISSDAWKRLVAIESLEELGVGFSLASHDLEIRGAGELLGESQSGEIDEVGFSLYSELLNRAVASLRKGQTLDLEETRHGGAEINIHVPVLLPDSYLPDIHMRLVLYKRISNARSDEILVALREEVIDRFGLLPEPATLLFEITSLRNRADALGIRKIDVGPKGARVDFHAKTQVDPASVIALLQSEPRTYRLEGPERIRISKDMPEAQSRMQVITTVLDSLAPVGMDD
ncbi:MAG: transcription-repair coupling factor [Acidiferrobacterales bacterium]